MILRGVDFGHVFVASGTLNFFGQGWPYHQKLKTWFWRGFDFTGATFVAKTATLESRLGNMPLEPANLQPIRFLPDCIKVFPLGAHVLNAVGLSGPGAENLLARGEWQKRKKPFMISFMAVKETAAQRIMEMRRFVNLLEKYLPSFGSAIGLQINLSCPNTQHCTADLLNEALELLKIAGVLKIPVDIKVNVFAPIDLIKRLEDQDICDCVTCSNTIKFGEHPGIEWKALAGWKRIFGRRCSPLEKYGGGGYSGKWLAPIVADWMRQARKQGVMLPLKFCGGILGPAGVLRAKNSGANAVEVGSIAILRPWRVKGTIKYADSIFGGK